MNRGGTTTALVLALAIFAALARESVVAQPGMPPQLIIDAPEHLTPIATRLTEVDGSTLLAVMRLVGVDRPVQPITVVLASEDSPLARSLPRWIAGFANATPRTVVLFPARSPSYPHDSLQDVLLHEIAHVLIEDAAGGEPVPRWFHEGVALAAERAWGLEDRTRLMVAVTIERRPLAQLDTAFRGTQGEAGRAYALAGAIVHQLRRDHGPEVAARILAGVRTGHRFEEAVRIVTGRSLVDVEHAFWRDSWWYQVIPFVTSSVVVWTGVLLLAVYAKRARARRRTELRRRWDEEEAADDADELATDDTDNKKGF